MIAHLAFLACAPAIITNLTKEWKDIDSKSLKVAERRCPTLYPDAPCLTKFTKVEDRMYRAICGDEIYESDIFTKGTQD